MQYQSGIHTIELRTENQIALSALPEGYRQAIEPMGRLRYKLNIPSLPDMNEYNNIIITQKAIDDALLLFSKIGAGQRRVTRIDYRFDDHKHDYAHNLPVMTVLVFLLAHQGGIFDRRAVFSDGEGIPSSIRAMPKEGDLIARYGIEYYDKERQKGTRQYGRARFELRRLNLNGEPIAYVVEEWRDKLQAITRTDYKAMLTERAKALISKRSSDIRKVRPYFIAREEEGIFMRLSGSAQSHYYCQNLPGWANVKAELDSITSVLERQLNPQ